MEISAIGFLWVGLYCEIDCGMVSECVVVVVVVPGVPGTSTGGGGGCATVVSSVVVETVCGGGGAPHPANIVMAPITAIPIKGRQLTFMRRKFSSSF
jgi:hypothetical protein